MKEILSQIKGLAAGDLVYVEWCDASIGKSLSNVYPRHEEFTAKICEFDAAGLASAL